MRKLLFTLMILVLVIPVSVLAAELPELDPEVEQAFKEAYAEGQYFGPEELSLRYLGEYDGCHIAFVDGPFSFTCEEWSEVVAGYEFWHGSGQWFSVYRDGKVTTLEGAYEAGWLSEEAVGRFWNYRTNDVYENPKTGDGILAVVAVMTLCGATLVALRRKVQ